MQWYDEKGIPSCISAVSTTAIVTEDIRCLPGCQAQTLESQVYGPLLLAVYIE